MDAKDIERIMAISNLLNNIPKPAGAPNGGLESKEKAKDTAVLNDMSKTDRQISALTNVLPYIEPSLRRGIYMVIKIMEIAEFERKNMVISAQNKNGYVFDRKKFIEAAEKSLTLEEKRSFETLCAITDIGNINFLKGDA